MTTYLRSIRLLTLAIFIFSFIDEMPATTKNAGGSFVATTQSYRHSQFEQASKLNQKEKGATAWLGERVNFQIYIWSSSENAAVKISSSKLSGEGVTTISPSNVKLAHPINHGD